MILNASPEAFPMAPPADLVRSEVIVAHDWQSFIDLKVMDDHWVRPGWYPGRRVYYWLLTFPHEGALLARARQCQEMLSSLRMDPVPEDGLHVTMVRIGDTSQVSPAALDMLARQARSLSVAPFDLVAHPLTGSRGAVRFSLSPWRPLVELHAALTALHVLAGVPGGQPTTLFRPHLGVAYNPRRRRTGPVRQAIAPLRELSPVTVPVRFLDLVELRRESAAYRWTVLHRVPLSAADAHTIGNGSSPA